MFFTGKGWLTWWFPFLLCACMEGRAVGPLGTAFRTFSRNGGWQKRNGAHILGHYAFFVNNVAPATEVVLAVRGFRVWGSYSTSSPDLRPNKGKADCYWLDLVCNNKQQSSRLCVARERVAPRKDSRLALKRMDGKWMFAENTEHVFGAKTEEKQRENSLRLLRDLSIPIGELSCLFGISRVRCTTD